MTVYITFTTIGADAGPFNLYSNADGFASSFAIGVPKAQLLAGFPATVPNGTTVVRAKSAGVCINYVDLPIGLLPTTSTTSSSSTSTTTTIPIITTTTSSTTSVPLARSLNIISDVTTPNGQSNTMIIQFANFTVGDIITWTRTLTELPASYTQECHIYDGGLININGITTASGSFNAPSNTFNITIDLVGSPTQSGGFSDFSMEFKYLGVIIPPDGAEVFLDVSTD